MKKGLKERGNKWNIYNSSMADDFMILWYQDVVKRGYIIILMLLYWCFFLFIIIIIIGHR